MTEREIFIEALQKGTAGERSAYLDAACGTDRELRGRVEQLLAEHEKEGSFLLDSPPAGFAATVVTPPIAETPGMVIGPYKLLEQIGEGGFGVVFMADQQAPVRRRVALKIIKPGMDTRQVLARFKAELQALSLMDHPNIARALDAGSTDSGRPYFVMELIRGVPITDYCDQNNLPVHERLDLFVQVCHAVQHAHQKGIIHRDIKPSNVLVTLHDGRPVPKVIDFGVAKAIDRQLTPETLFTRFAEMIGTPLYMSPEQAEMTGLDIDTRADIYSLGVLLYELLTGSTPFDKDRLRQAAYDEIRRIIREEDPPKPSLRISTLGDRQTAVAAHRHADPHRLSQLVRGDLDWIAMKALEKDRTRRYETASNFAADVLRYLSHRPVEARPHSAVYQFGKFARRNRVAFTTAMLVLAAILLGTVVSVTQAIRATRAERLAETRLQTETEARNEAEAARQTAEQARHAETAQRQIAVSQRQVAERERLEATRQRDSATRQLYVSQMNLAQRAWDENNVGRVCELLESQMPQQTGDVDLRGWEWRYLWRLSHSELRRLTYPDGAAPLCVAFSPDGQFFLTGLADGTLKTYSADGRHEIRSVKAHGDRITGLAFRRDAKTFASTSRDGTARIWDTATGRELQSFPSTRTIHYPVGVLSPDGSHFAVTVEKVIKIWETSSGKAVWSLEGHGANVVALAFSPDGKQLFSGSWDSTAAMWDLSTGRRIRTFDGRKTTLDAVAVSPDGRLFVAGWRDGRMKSWDLRTGKELTEFQGHRGFVSRLVFSPDGTRLASVSNDTTVKLWDPATGKEIQTFRGHASSVVGVAFSPDDAVIVSAAWDNTIRFWDAASRQEPWSQPYPGVVIGVQYSPDGRSLAAGSGGAVAVWDVSTGQQLWTEREMLACGQQGNGDRTAANNCLVFDPASRILAVGGMNGEIHFRDARDGVLLRTIKAHGGAVISLAYSPNGHVLASAGVDRQVALWNPVDGSRIAVLTGHKDTVGFVTFSPDGRFLASGSDEKDRSVRLWDVSTGQLVRTFVAQDGICCVIFSRDGRQIFSGGSGEMIHVWDVETGRTIRMHRGHAGTVQCLSLSPNGTRLASCGDDKTVRIWDLSTGQELQTLKPNAGDVLCVAFSPDGFRLAAGSFYGLVTVWDARPLSDDVRAELVAADLLRRDEVTDEKEFLRRVREHASIDDTVRQRALRMAGSYWRNRWRAPLELFQALVRRGQPKEIHEFRAAWHKALQHNTPQHEAWYGYAELCLFFGDVEEYRRHRAELLARFGDTTNPVFAERVSRACLLLPASGDELQRAAALADRAIAAGPQHGSYGLFLAAKGLAEYRLGRFDSAIGWLQQADARGVTMPVTRLVLAMARQRSGQTQQAREVLAATLQSYDWSATMKHYPDEWIAHVLRHEAEPLVVPNLSAFLNGEYQPHDNKERLELIEACRFRKRYSTVTGLCADVFAAEPKLADDLMAGHRYNAACAAALAGSGKGHDAGKLKEEERARLRRQALDWLQADLAISAKRLQPARPEVQGANPQDPTVVRQRLEHWRRDDDLIGIRDSAALAKLPPGERAGWVQLWADVEDLLRKTGGQPSAAPTGRDKSAR